MFSHLPKTNFQFQNVMIGFHTVSLKRENPRKLVLLNFFSPSIYPSECNTLMKLLVYITMKSLTTFRRGFVQKICISFFERLDFISEVL